MYTKAKILFLILIVTPLSTCSAADLSHKSKYAGEEKREIKSLSETDIEELKNGKGWGLAKAAELNGMPGPAHLLEMKDEIDLSANQVRAIEDLYKKMKQEAIPLGFELIKLEDLFTINRFPANNWVLKYPIPGPSLSRTIDTLERKNGII